MKPIRNVLFATDFSPASRPAFRQAIGHALANRATLWIAHVIPPIPKAAGGDLVPRMYREMGLAIRDDAEKRLGALAKTARRAGARVQARVLHGVPHEAIGRAARACRAGLVVLGTHGRTGAARFFIGSVAARVVATAPCPVLTVRSG